MPLKYKIANKAQAEPMLRSHDRPIGQTCVRAKHELATKNMPEQRMHSPETEKHEVEEEKTDRGDTVSKVSE